jgi:hypothetical protein
VAKAVKGQLGALQDGLGLLRRIETDLTDDAIATLRLAHDTQALLWPELEPLAPVESRKDLQALEAHLKADRPWEDLADLKLHVSSLRQCYRDLREGILSAQAVKLEAAIERVKRRDGFERLNPDQRHQVISHLREGAPIQTKAEDLVPALRLLDNLFAAWLEAAEHKAQTQLDEILETFGESPTVEVELELRGRMVRSASELDRLLADVRDRIVRELEANHRIRIK